ncbi:MAG TPA: sulfotransferase [Gammaproteobacteria bacterium]|nr:sulfotransferase [Gammaproteobacteria bacterium]
MEKLFLMGAPRSGTTYVQLVIAQHPAIVTCNETHVFDGYLESMFAHWRGHLRDPRAIGLSACMDSEDFRALVRDQAELLFEQMLAAQPTDGCKLFLEKTPAHVLNWRNIVDVYPDARFIHLVRDPRGVVASLRRAGRGWGSHWAKPGILSNANRWRRYVTSGLEAEAVLGERCRRLSYETVLRSPADMLGQVYQWLGLPQQGLDLEGMAAQCRPEQLKTGDAASPWNTGAEPEGFFGGRGAKGWENDLSRFQTAQVELVAGQLLDTLGYGRVTSPGLRARMVNGVYNQVASLEWRLGQLRSGM